MLWTLDTIPQQRMLGGGSGSVEGSSLVKTQCAQAPDDSVIFAVPHVHALRCTNHPDARCRQISCNGIRVAYKCTMTRATATDRKRKLREACRPFHATPLFPASRLIYAEDQMLQRSSGVDEQMRLRRPPPVPAPPAGKTTTRSITATTTAPTPPSRNCRRKCPGSSVARDSAG